MKLVDIHQALMITSAEKLDEEGRLIPHQARREADELLEGDRVGRPSEAIIARSKALSNYLAVKAPTLLNITHQLSTLSTSIFWISILISFCLGFGVHSLGEGREFHLVSPILLSLLIWNLISMTLILWSSRAQRKSSESLLTSGSSKPIHTKIFSSKSALITKRSYTWIQLKLSGLTDKEGRQQSTLHVLQGRILKDYLEKLWDISQPQLRAEFRRILHLMSATFVIGALLSAYWDGLIYQYKASAESTFLSPEGIESLLSVLLFPATLMGLGDLSLSGFELTGKRGILAGDAAIWIHRYTISMITWVVLPRLILALLETLKVWKSTLKLPYKLKWFEQVPTLNIGLASHTNVGKTSLARTLLKRDVGLVEDAQHVTQSRACYFLMNRPDIRVRLWDTPGFGELTNSPNVHPHQTHPSLEIRLEKEAYQALGEEADVILYLVSAWPTEREIIRVTNELQLLGTHQKPIILVINRLMDGHELEHSNVQENTLKETSRRQWRHLLGEQFNRGIVNDICVLDAFDRAMSDERVLYQTLHKVVPPSLAPLAVIALEEWERGHHLLIERVSACIQQSLLQLLTLEERVLEKGKRGKADSRTKLNQSSEEVLDQTLSHLLDLFGLEGSIRADVSQAALRITFLRTDHKEKRTWGAIWGGAITGLGSGVMADIMSGGLSLGGGMIVGAVIGAVGGASLVEGYEYLSEGEDRICLSIESVYALSRQLLLFTLDASAHGRARGEYQNQSFENKVRHDAEVDQLQHLDQRCIEVTQSLFKEQGDLIKSYLTDFKKESTEVDRCSSAERLSQELSKMIEQGLERV